MEEDSSSTSCSFTPNNTSTKHSNDNNNSKLWESLKWVISSLSVKPNRLFSASTACLSVLFPLFILYALIFTRWFGIWTLITRTTFFCMNNLNYPRRDEYPLRCTSSNMTITCPSNYPNKTNLTFDSNRTCPDYFRWIHEDLKTWKKEGITREMVESLEKDAHFRLIIVNGTVYVKEYNKAFQTRDVFTLWGILQLIKLYPGMLPDLDLMFQCHDEASIKKDNYKGENGAFAPPQFHYCGDESTFDIVFPDWSFWGWPEINIKPWVPLEKDLEEGNTMKNWTSREPFAYWKGNLHTGARRWLEHCNSINNWNARIDNQNWGKETKEGFKNSDLSKQCIHRYKIYIEGNAWSVSETYILACDSMTLRVNPIYYNFFTRSLIPMKHYWPINPKNLCNSIKFAVDWGNNNTDKAQEIGKAGSKFIFEQLKMENVYDYMFHVLHEYAKLLKYKPTLPEGAIELCSERFACSPIGLDTTYKIESMVHQPSQRGLCQLPQPYYPSTIETIRNQNSKIKEVVEMWENKSP